MPRPPGAQSRDSSTTIAVRLPNNLAEAAREAAGGQEGLSAWLRELVRAATADGGAGDADRSEGWKAGWTAANRQFRRALQNVLDEEPPEA